MILTKTRDQTDSYQKDKKILESFAPNAKPAGPSPQPGMIKK